MRQAEIERNTFETKIKLSLNLDAQEPVSIDTGVGFFDHMLTLFVQTQPHVSCGKRQMETFMWIVTTRLKMLELC